MSFSSEGAQQASLTEGPTHSRNFRYDPSLDHIRFLAFFLVFGYHIYGQYVPFGKASKISLFTGIITEGYTGVALFFVLSGFLFMSIALDADRLHYRGFIFNRVLRIYPLFLFIFFIAISINTTSFTPASIFYIFFTNLGGPPTSASVVTGAAWTISVEFTFYLVFPFLAAFAKQRGPAYLLQLLLIMLVIRLVAYAVSEQPTGMYYSTLIGRFDQFLIGMLAAQVTSRLSITLRLSRMVLAAGAVAIVVMVWVQGRHAPLAQMQHKQPLWIVWGVIEAACWATFIVGYSRASISWPPLLRGWLRRGGELSYSLYLMHMIAVMLLLRYVGPLAAGYGNWVLFMVNGSLALALTWAVSSLTFRAIEQPFQSMRRRYVGGRQGSAG